MLQLVWSNWLRRTVWRFNIWEFLLFSTFKSFKMIFLDASNSLKAWSLLRGKNSCFLIENRHGVIIEFKIIAGNFTFSFISYSCILSQHCIRPPGRTILWSCKTPVCVTCNIGSYVSKCCTSSIDARKAHWCCDSISSLPIVADLRSLLLSYLMRRITRLWLIFGWVLLLN